MKAVLHIAAIVVAVIVLFAEDVLAVYKLQDDTPLVGADYAKPNVVYLFQFPRTELTPSQAALCLMVETWAHWNRDKVSFRRISNKFFLGSKTEGTAPFAQINGKFVDGSENIISALAQMFEINVKMNREQKEVKELCENVLFSILMVDRAHHTNATTNAGGLDFMLNDKGIQEQMIPLVVNEKSKNNVFQLSIDNSGTMQTVKNEDGKSAGDGEFSIEFDANVWGDYFEAYWSKDENEKVNFLTKHLITNVTNSFTFDLEHWKAFDVWCRKNVIDSALRAILKKSGPNDTTSSEAKLEQFLNGNEIEWDFKEGGKTIKPYSKLSVGEVVEIVRDCFVKFTNIYDRNSASRPPKFLFGETPTLADAALFGVLIQFFETPINIGPLKLYIQSHGDALARMRHFVSVVKGSLGLRLPGWKHLTKRPWTQNYEDDSAKALEQIQLQEYYDGPYKIPKIELAKLNVCYINELEHTITSNISAAGVKEHALDENKLRQHSAFFQAILKAFVNELNVQNRLLVQENMRQNNDIKSILNIIFRYLNGGEFNHLLRTTVNIPRMKIAVHAAVTEHFDAEVEKNVLAAISKAQSVVNNALAEYNALKGKLDAESKAKAAEMLAIAKNAVSDSRLTNEH